MGMTQQPVRLGILSTAHINRLVIPPAQESDLVELVAVASRDPARGGGVGAEWRIPRGRYGSYEALLADPEVERSTSRSRTRSTSSGRSARSRRASTCSARSRSPRSAADVEAAFDAADRAGRILMEAFMYRHNPQTRKLVELVSPAPSGASV